LTDVAIGARLVAVGALATIVACDGSRPAVLAASAAAAVWLTRIRGAPWAAATLLVVVAVFGAVTDGIAGAR
jgi:hypothetical protein